MTDRIGIDEQIAYIESLTVELGDPPESFAILSTLRDYKRIMELLREPSEEMVSEGKLAAVKTHDVRNVFTAMSAALLVEVEKESK